MRGDPDNTRLSNQVARRVDHARAVTIANLDTDADALQAWLHSLAGVRASTNTYDTYSFEAARWLAFLRLRHGESATLLAMATEADAMDYLRALLGEPVAGRQAGRMSKPIGKRDARPLPYFTKPLQLRSARTCIARLMSLYAWLLDKNNFPKTHRAYLQHNPFHSLAKRELRGVAQNQVKRLFPEKALTAMLDAVQRDCDAPVLDTPGLSKGAAQRKRLHAERTRWILILLFVVWLRRDELARLRMNDFQHEHLEGKWVLNVLGKGGKPRTIPLPPIIVSSLARYRTAMGLPPLPEPDDPLPAILPIPRGNSHGGTQASQLSADVIYTAIKNVARKAAESLEASDPEEAKRPGSDLAMAIRTLRSLSPHWFRHSGATTALNRGMPLQEASKLLGHASPATTANMYHHLDDEAVRDRLEATFAGVIQ